MQKNNELNTALAIFFLAVAVIMIGGLIVIPVIEAAEAANGISESRNKGQRGDVMSEGKRNGGSGGGGCETC